MNIMHVAYGCEIFDTAKAMQFGKFILNLSRGIKIVSTMFLKKSEQTLF